MQLIDNGCEPIDQFRVTIPKFIECSRLFFENSQDRIWGHAYIDHVGEWVIPKIFPSRSSILGQGDIEEIFEVEGGGYIWCLGHGLVEEMLEWREGSEGDRCCTWVKPVSNPVHASCPTAEAVLTWIPDCGTCTSRLLWENNTQDVKAETIRKRLYAHVLVCILAPVSCY